MWRGPGQDPDDSGGGPGLPVSQELIDLKDQFNQQQVLIAQLKEMLRKNEQATVTQEKVDEYASKLIKMNARAKKSVVRKGGIDTTVENKRIDTPASEKINLLRRQLEQNKMKLAERGKNQKDIEEKFTQLKAQLDDTQNMSNVTPINLSLVDTKPESYNENTSSQELYTFLLTKDKKIMEMSTKIEKLEANVLDLQENLKEKDSVIDARTKAITLMSENLSKKGKSTLDTLDETKLQMRSMQENFVDLETKMKEKNQELSYQLESKETEIIKLKQSNDFLENMRHDLTLTNKILQEKVDMQLELIENQKMELHNLQNKLSHEQINVNEEILKLNGRITELEELNSQLHASLDCSRISLESDKQKNNESDDTDGKSQLSDLRNITDTEHVDFELKIAELEKLNEEKSALNCDYAAKISELEDCVKELNDKIFMLKSENKGKKLDFDIKSENEEIAKLKRQLDESNKNMIKVKASNKSKIKELNKKVDAFKKMGDGTMEVVKLYDENAKLNQKVAELEEEKGALQLKIMESSKDSTTVEAVRELEIKLTEQSNEISAKEELIVSLQKQIVESESEVCKLTEKIDRLSHLENIQVKSEISSIQFEEQMDKLEIEKIALTKEKEKILDKYYMLLEQLEEMKKQKHEIASKLESYMQENIDLIDKLEKLSAEKVSSAESIEIVEGLTQQEKLELEAYQKNINISTGIKTSTENLDENQDLNESVNQLTEETSELLQKIELFTVERREVMEKMEHLTQENNQLNLKIKEIENNRDVLAETYEQLQNEKEKLDNNLEALKNEKVILEKKLNDLQTENEELKNSIENYQLKEDKHNEEVTKPEIEEYRALNEIQRQEINELRVKLMDNDLIRNEKIEIETKLTSMQIQYEKLLEENDALQFEIKRNNENIHEKDQIEAEFKMAKKQINELEENISNNLSEINNYKLIFEENKNELVTSANLINSLRLDIQNKESELENHKSQIEHLNSVVADLNNAITKLEEENNKNAQSNEKLELMTNEVSELKQMLKENIEQLQKYEKEIEANITTINILQEELLISTDKIRDTAYVLDCKDNEIKNLKQEEEERKALIIQLRNEIAQKDDNFHREFESLKQKCLTLHNQIQNNSTSIDDIRNPLESRINELENKNKEQLERMKKIAANLKKKSTAYQDLEQKYSEINEKWLIEQKEKESLKIELNKNAALESKVQSLIEQLNEVENELSNIQNLLEVKVEEYNKLLDDFTKCKDSNVELSQQVSNYVIQVESLQNVLKEYENKVKILSSEYESYRSNANNDLHAVIMQKDVIIKNLDEQLENLKYSAETSSNGLCMKIQELELFIETQDVELNKFKERNIKLEEGLANMEERRMSLERQTIELGNQLEEKSNIYEEVSQTEDLLEKRLSALIAHDELVEKHLRETISENQELIQQNKLITHENDELNLKLRLTNEKVNEIKQQNENVSVLENEILELKEIITNLETEKKQIKNDYERKLKNNTIEIEKSELELQNQLQLFSDERKNLTEVCEKLNDQLKEYVQTHETMNRDIFEYKQKLEERENAILAQTSEYEKLNEDFKMNANIINELNENIQDLKSQLLFEKESGTNLKILQQKDLVIEEYEMEKINNPKVDSINKLEEFQGIISSLENHQLIETQNELQKLKEEMQINELKIQTNSLDINDSKLIDENINIVKETALEGPIRKFTWPETSSDPFDFVSEISIPPQKDDKIQTENTKDELLKKIKTLEFMLYNMEKEKNEALLQCNELSGELTRLVYDRENGKHFNKSKALENEIVSVSSVSDVPPMKCLESEILSPSETEFSQKDQKEMRNFEFVNTKPLIKCDSLEPVNEDMIQPKSAYLCYIPGDKQTSDCATNTSNISFDTVGENDDGWAWGPEEAKLEQEHQEKVESSPHNVQFRAQINELEEKIRILERSRERHLDEIKQSQLKSGKLIKKLKEFKTKNEQLSSQVNRKPDKFDDLDSAIQEELKSQIQTLEKKVGEINSEYEKEKQEKNNLLKRIDVLTAANERMIENKEKQDVEILVWQQKTRDLSSKLEQFEWGDGAYETPKREDIKNNETSNDINGFKQQVTELTDTIKDLMVDNEELQALLEEQRNLRISAEKAKSTEPILENVKTETEYLNLLAEIDSLKSNSNIIVQEKMKLEDEIKDLTHNQVLINNQQTNKENQELNGTVSYNKQLIADLNRQLDDLQSENYKLHEKQMTFNEVKNTVDDLQAKLVILNNQLGELDSENTTLKNSLDKLNNEKEELLKQVLEKDVKFNEISSTVSEQNGTIYTLQQEVKMNQALSSELDKLKECQKEKDYQLVELTEKLNEQKSEFEIKFSTMMEQLTEEWTQRVDQRGISVAESWKLHLDARENEFTEMEQQLRKEINEFEEKYNGLVNENNELRKNVDTEIRNEVDRVSALQQQINDRQHYINDLTKLLQEKQLNLEQQLLENVSLGSKIQELELQIVTIEPLQQKITESEKLIEDYKHKLENMKINNEKLANVLEEVEKYKININTLEKQLNEKDELLQEYSQKNSIYIQEIEEYKESYATLQQKIKEKDMHIDDLLSQLRSNESQREITENQLMSLQQQIYDYQQQLVANDVKLQQSYTQIDALNQEISNYSSINSQLAINETEIVRLKSLLAENEREFNYTLENKSLEAVTAINEQAKELDTLKRRLTETENHYEELLSVKDIDIENLRLQLQQQINQNDDIIREKITECEELKNKLQEQNILLDEENKQLCELREIIQEQVLKIDDLQKELYEKSRDYDALIAEIDITPKQEKHVKFADEAERKISEDLSEPVSRAELDLALYMLHQRDVRCEELTVELMQLLEERDTLQLKLSNALREKEDMKCRVEYRDEPLDDKQEKENDRRTGAVPKIKTSAETSVITETEVPADSKQDTSDQLTTKLSELKMVGYRKDKTLLDEQQLRRFQQISIMQQHRDEAAKLPPEAAARLVDANYTLSRDVQSPSKVLLNWLWGRSTPKVNNI